MKTITITTTRTSRSDSFNAWGRMIKDIPMLTAEEEAELAYRIQKGDKRSEDKLIRANLRFVISVAKRYDGQGLQLMDLIQQGNIGLIEAARKFDASRGFKFISYAVYHIRRSIMEALNKEGSFIRKSDTHVRSIAAINKAAADFEQKNGRTPTIDELAELTGIDDARLHLYTEQSYDVTSAETPLSEDGGNIYDLKADDDAPATDDAAEKSSLSISVRATIKKLTERERDIILRFFGIGREPQSIAKIALEYSLTQEAVRQIKNKAIQRLSKDPDIMKLSSAC